MKFRGSHCVAGEASQNFQRAENVILINANGKHYIHTTFLSSVPLVVPQLQLLAFPCHKLVVILRVFTGPLYAAMVLHAHFRHVNRRRQYKQASSSHKKSLNVVSQAVFA